ncbi:MAG: hypothetical protein ACPIOQ_74315 [Promethearchaeia archaeon]
MHGVEASAPASSGIYARNSRRHALGSLVWGTHWSSYVSRRAIATFQGGFRLQDSREALFRGLSPMAAAVTVLYGGELAKDVAARLVEGARTFL